jgi:hypothetical protein
VFVVLKKAYIPPERRSCSAAAAARGILRWKKVFEELAEVLELLCAMRFVVSSYFRTRSGADLEQVEADDLLASMSANQSPVLADTCTLFSICLLLINIASSSFSNHVNEAQIADKLFPVPVGDSKHPTEDDPMHS